MKLKKLFLIGAVVMAAASVMGQGMRGMRGMMNNPVFLLGRDDVKTDLALTDDQKNKLADMQTNMRQDMMAAFQSAGQDPDARAKVMADMMKKSTDSVNAILTPDQQKRLKEISLQLGGYSAIASDKDLQSKLELTDAQKSKLTELSTQFDAAMSAVGEKMRNQEIDREAGMASVTKNREAMNTSVESVLTADQKAKFKAMGGKPFVATSQPQFGGRGGGLLL